MLNSLYIQNFALLNEVKLDFHSGYTVITGETGSGKSILLNALNLILGERADFKVIGPRGDKAIVEAEFTIDLKQFQSFFDENDIDAFPTTIVRREISSQGRSRAFINDVPVQLNVLKAFSENVVSIHSQYNTLDLKRKEYQLETLDTLADLVADRKAFQIAFANYKEVSNRLEKLKNQYASEQKDKDYNEFQLNELRSLNLSSNDFVQLEAELNRIENSDTILNVYAQIRAVLSDENAVLDQLRNLKSALVKAGSLDETIRSFEERIQSVLVELVDVEASAEDEASKLEIDPSKKVELQEKVDEYNRIALKHRAEGQHQLLELMNELSSLVDGLDELEAEIGSLEEETAKALAKSHQLAGNLFEARSNAKATIEKQLTDLLNELKLPETTVNFKLTRGENLSNSGDTLIDLLFSANKGVSAVPIENAASGGELSRVMLALQKMISEKKKLPTVFFDEIDTGVSGDVAQKIGTLLHSMGQNMQLIAISHLPQVAAKAHNHLKVEKSSNTEMTQTSITELLENQRVEEIARLMSGEQINEAAISNAKALMN